VKIIQRIVNVFGHVDLAVWCRTNDEPLARHAQYWSNISGHEDFTPDDVTLAGQRGVALTSCISRERARNNCAAC
jgi:hypothetical protein